MEIQVKSANELDIKMIESGEALVSAEIIEE